MKWTLATSSAVAQQAYLFIRQLLPPTPYCTLQEKQSVNLCFWMSLRNNETAPTVHVTSMLDTKNPRSSALDLSILPEQC